MHALKARAIVVLMMLVCGVVLFVLSSNENGAAEHTGRSERESVPENTRSVIAGATRSDARDDVKVETVVEALGRPNQDRLSSLKELLAQFRHVQPGDSEWQTAYDQLTQLLRALLRDPKLDDPIEVLYSALECAEAESIFAVSLAQDGARLLDPSFRERADVVARVEKDFLSEETPEAARIAAYALMLMQYEDKGYRALAHELGLAVAEITDDRTLSLYILSNVPFDGDYYVKLDEVLAERSRITGYDDIDRILEVMTVVLDREQLTSEGIVDPGTIDVRDSRDAYVQQLLDRVENNSAPSREQLKAVLTFFMRASPSSIPKLVDRIDTTAYDADVVKALQGFARHYQEAE